MEQAIELNRSKCKYFWLGCPEALVDSERSEHEDWCSYIRYLCPFPVVSCIWKGTHAQMLPHLTTQHSLKMTQGETVELVASDINSPGTLYWALVQSCFERHFIVVLWRRELQPGLKQFCAVVRMIGSKKQAEGYNYKLELAHPPRRLSWEGIPFNLNQPIRTHQFNTVCLKFDADQAILFAKDGLLTITATISESK